MVIGNGLLAKRFESYRERDDVVIFASGVSNSKTFAKEEFEREFELLRNTIESNPGKKFIYFSTSSILDPSLYHLPYIKHKLHIEQWIKDHMQDYLIFRVANVVGPGGNPATIFNFLVHAIDQQIPFDLWSRATRNFIDIDDVFKLVQYYIQFHIKPGIYYLASAMNYPAIEIVKKIEVYLGKRGKYISMDAGSAYSVDNEEVLSIAKKAGVSFTDHYLENLLKKYHPLS